jgi:hypothetical protein
MVISSARIFTRRRAAVSIAGSNGAFGLGGGGYGGGSSHGGFLRAYGKRDPVERKSQRNSSQDRSGRNAAFIVGDTMFDLVNLTASSARSRTGPPLQPKRHA